MATSSISGLVSGLNTADIIKQLMQLEAIPQTKLKDRIGSAQSALTSLQTTNSLVASIAARAKELSNVANWSPLRATTTNSAVTATVSAGGQAGSWNVQVDRLATTHRMRFTDTAALDTVVVSGGTTVDLTIDGTTTTLDTGDGTLKGLVTALNASGTGVNASTVRLDDGTHRLVVQSTQTGESQRFTLANTGGAPLLSGATVVDGEDAAITIEGQTVHSATNTFADSLPGMTLTIGADAVGKSVAVTVATDTTTAAKAVKELVDQINNVIGQMQTLTAFNPTTKASGALAGDSAVRAVAISLQQSIFPGGNSTLAGLGLQSDRKGKITFDEAKFNEALTKDPAGVAASITGPDGWAARAEKVAKAASDPTTGTLTAGITGRTSTITQLQDSVESWDVRLALRRTSLERTYTALETAMNRMQSQSNWLAGQLNSLSSSSNS